MVRSCNETIRQGRPNPIGPRHTLPTPHRRNSSFVEPFVSPADLPARIRELEAATLAARQTAATTPLQLPPPVRLPADVAARAQRYACHMVTEENIDQYVLMLLQAYAARVVL